MIFSEEMPDHIGLTHYHRFYVVSMDFLTRTYDLGAVGERRRVFIHHVFIEELWGDSESTPAPTQPPSRVAMYRARLKRRFTL